MTVSNSLWWRISLRKLISAFVIVALVVSLSDFLIGSAVRSAVRGEEYAADVSVRLVGRRGQRLRFDEVTHRRKEWHSLRKLSSTSNNTIYNANDADAFPVHAVPPWSFGPPLLKKSSNLVAVTTMNHWADSTEICLASLIRARNYGEAFDIAIFDDESEDGSRANAAAMGIPVFANPGIRGVTYTWNMAWRVFMEYGYETLFIVNNDIWVPFGAIGNLTAALAAHSEIDAIGPMTDMLGCGKVPHARRNTVESLLPDVSIDAAELRKTPIQQASVSVQRIQDSLPKNSTVPSVKRVPWILGFFMGFHVRSAALALSSGVMFEPSNKIVGQENNLFLKRRLRAYVSRESFVYHKKGTTVQITDCIRKSLPNSKRHDQRNDILLEMHGLKKDGTKLNCEAPDGDHHENDIMNAKNSSHRNHHNNHPPL